MADLRQTILDADDIESEVVDVDVWGVKVLLRSPTAKRRSRLMRQFIDPSTGEVDYERMYPSLVIATAHDPETGEPLFTDDDEAALGGKNGKAMEQLAQVAMRLAGFKVDEAVDEGKADSY